jgi:hypothetical protein
MPRVVNNNPQIVDNIPPAVGNLLPVTCPCCAQPRLVWLNPPCCGQVSPDVYLLPHLLLLITPPPAMGRAHVQGSNVHKAPLLCTDPNPDV